MFLLKKDISKVKNTMLQWILQNILEDQTFQRIAKFMMTDSYEMDFMIGIVILVKVDEIHWSLPLNVHTFSTPIPFNKGQTSSRIRYSCRERV